MSYTIHHGDCLDVLKTMDENSVDSIVTDPPYGLSFMGKAWDYSVPSAEVWAECLRVLKPGGHLLAFAGTRTQHRMAVNIEDAGFEIRDMIAWVYGSGFPKSHDVSKAIDRAAGAEREVVGVNANSRPAKRKGGAGFDAAVGGEALGDMPITAPATPEAQQWSGWGTALKPALEPITVARKPLIGTVADNVLTHGTGAINVDGCRVSTDHADFEKLSAGVDAIRKRGGTMQNSWANHSDLSGANPANELGRWPANFIHDGSHEATQGLGEASRYFYCAKASKKDRDEGLQEFELKVAGGMSGRQDGSMGSVTMTRNHHPTVKPTDLMRYLVRLVTPPNGTVLDPFMGSGSTGKGAVIEGFDFIGIELDADYIEIAQARIESVDPDQVLKQEQR